MLSFAETSVIEKRVCKIKINFYNYKAENLNNYITYNSTMNKFIGCTEFIYEFIYGISSFNCYRSPNRYFMNKVVNVNPYVTLSRIKLFCITS